MAALKYVSGPLPCSTKTDEGWQAFIYTQEGNFHPEELS